MLASAAPVTMLVLPAVASAHGLVVRADLPIPEWLFTFAASAVVVVTFVLLAMAWRRPALQDPVVRWLPPAAGRILTVPALEVLTGAVGVALLVVVVWAGFAGTIAPTANVGPTIVYIAFWLGFVPLSIAFGDVFSLFNPWRAVGRGCGWVLQSAKLPAPLPYPERLGRWPAAVALMAFAWFELVTVDGDLPENVAVATCVYTAIQLGGMALYGTDAWTSRAEGFGVYFGLLARLSPWVREGRRIGLRRPLSGLTSVASAPGTVALLAVVIGSTSFDGFSGGQTWQQWTKSLLDVFGGLGLSQARTLELVYAGGLIGAVLAVAVFYWIGCAITRRLAADERSARALMRRFVPSLVPIAAAYIVAHYVSLLLLQGQSLGYLASDPLGDGSDLFGTATWAIDYGWISSETFWYIQVTSVVAGHVAALAVAHDYALVDYGRSRTATRSQYGMLVVMVGFTTLALWLLSEVAKG